MGETTDTTTTPAVGWIDYGGCLRWNAGDPAAAGATCTGCGRAPHPGHGVTAEAPPHPRTRFEMYACAPPAGEWSYSLDDHDVTYVRGQWWPYDRAVRLAPGTAYQAWNTEYVLCGPAPQDPETVQAGFSLYLRPQGMGAFSVRVSADVHLPTGRVTLRPDDVDGELRAQAEDKARRLADFINAERLRATSPPYPPRPVTAHERYTAALTADRTGGAS